MEKTRDFYVLDHAEQFYLKKTLILCEYDEKTAIENSPGYDEPFSASKSQVICYESIRSMILVAMKTSDEVLVPLTYIYRFCRRQCLVTTPNKSENHYKFGNNKNMHVQVRNALRVMANTKNGLWTLRYHDNKMPFYALTECGFQTTSSSCYVLQFKTGEVRRVPTRKSNRIRKGNL